MTDYGNDYTEDDRKKVEDAWNRILKG